jgi:hypothetical protein
MAGALEIAEAFAAKQTDPTTRHHVENLAREVRRLRVELVALGPIEPHHATSEEHGG